MGIGHSNPREAGGVDDDGGLGRIDEDDDHNLEELRAEPESLAELKGDVRRQGGGVFLHLVFCAHPMLAYDS